MTGYEIRETIASTIGHFWSESFGQIYPALASLEAEGCIRRADGSGRAAPPYEITDAGLKRLQRELAQEWPKAKPRNGLLFRLFLGRHLPEARVTALLDAAEKEASEALDRYTALADQILSEPRSRDRDLRLSTVTFGVEVARAQAHWAAQTRELLASRDAADSVVGNDADHPPDGPLHA